MSRRCEAALRLRDASVRKKIKDQGKRKSGREYRSQEPGDRRSEDQG